MNQPKNNRAIMLSSTFADLRDHRQRAIEAIDKLGYASKFMEYTATRAALKSSLKKVRASAAYVCIISLKYGETPVDPVRNPNQLSITELEYNEAMECGRPIILFIMGDEHPINDADVESDPSKRKKLDAFRERAKHMSGDRKAQQVYERFESPAQFSAVAISIGNLVQRLEGSIAPSLPEKHRTLRNAISNLSFDVTQPYVGRETELVTIHNYLRGFDRSVPVVAIYGLNGTGKTRLAAAYAGRHPREYRVRWLIRAHSRANDDHGSCGSRRTLGFDCRQRYRGIRSP